MGTITGQYLITSAQLTLKDAGAIRWTRTELLGYLNDGQRELVTIKPEACTINTAIKLAAGLTKQSVPDAAIALLDVTRNMGSDGTTPGRAISITSKSMLDAVAPTWSSASNSEGYITHFTYDPRNPKVFYVYKKAPATDLYVEVMYSSVPAAAADSSTGVIGVDDIYANALLDYVLYRAYAKDAETQNAQLATAHYQAFENSLGIKASGDLASNPNLKASQFNPAISGSAKI